MAGSIGRRWFTIFPVREGGRRPAAWLAGAWIASLWWLLRLPVVACVPCTFAGDWPQWGGGPGRNMVSQETGLPGSFVPGQKRSSSIDMSTSLNVAWAVRLGTHTCSTPAVARGRVFIGTGGDDLGMLKCLDQQTGELLWQWAAPPRPLPESIDGYPFFFARLQSSLGVCSSPTVDEERVYFVSHRCEVICLDAQGLANGNQGPFTGEAEYAAMSAKAPDRSQFRGADILWVYDMYEEVRSRPSDACNGSLLIHGDVLYACTSNGVDRWGPFLPNRPRQPLSPEAPSLIALDKHTGRLLALDAERIGTRLLHGQWSSPSCGTVNGRTLVFYGGGDGVCYAFEALKELPSAPVPLKKVWSFDCNPPEYRESGRWSPIDHYRLGDRRVPNGLNTNDGTFVGLSEIVATPVFRENRVYVAVGRDPEHGRGKGALHCIDATKAGDISREGAVWSYRGLDRTLSTVSVTGSDGLLYLADVAGRLHCLDAETGHCHWVHETNEPVWASTLVADGKVYLPTRKHFWVLAAGKEKRVLSRISLGAPLAASPVAANGMLFVASNNYLWAVREQR